jgi:pyridinium-3,5-biscarboxylic acid mononucleotide synthase
LLPGGFWQAWGVDEVTLRAILDDLAAGRVSADEVVARLRRLPFADVGDALVDHHRALRQGMPEAVFGPGKTPEQCARIVAELIANGDGPVLVTRVSAEQVKAVEAAVGPGLTAAGCLLYRAPQSRGPASVVVATAGTADGPVADECELTLRAYGFDPARLDDIGVAGLHRLLAHVDDVMAADAIVVVAGMEGALASVVGGLTAAPVIAVPTSVGYGSSLDGVTALLAMLASCASGVTVVGVDNGFGAACAVARMLRAQG